MAGDWRELQFDFLEHPLQIREDPSSYYNGTTVWDAGKVLAKYFEHNKRKFDTKEKRVLELGSGCGLVGLCLGLLGFEVVLTDCAEALDNLQENVRRNCSLIPQLSERVCVEEFVWGSDPTEIGLHVPFDLVVGSDVVFNEASVPLLIDSIVRCSNHHTKIFLCVEFRCSEVQRVFNEYLTKASIHSRTIPSKKLHPEYRHNLIQIYSLRLQFY